jgi:hypothetical protein
LSACAGITPNHQSTEGNIMHRRRLAFLATILSAALAGPAAAPALAQAPAPEPGPQLQQPQAQEQVTEDELRTFAVAALQVQQITQQYVPQSEAAGTPEEQEALRQQALEQAAAAVEETGLQVADYNRISMAVQQDEAIAQQVAEYMREAAGVPGQAPQPQQ